MTTTEIINKAAFALWAIVLCNLAPRLMHVLRHQREPFPTEADAWLFLAMNVLCLTVVLTS